MHMLPRARRLFMLISATSAAIGMIYPLDPLDAQQPAAATCRITGRAMIGTTPLPGVSIVAIGPAATVAGATSTETDGTYQLAVPSGTYQLKAELTGFTPFNQAVTLAGEP